MQMCMLIPSITSFNLVHASHITEILRVKLGDERIRLGGLGRPSKSFLFPYLSPPGNRRCDAVAF